MKNVLRLLATAAVAAAFALPAYAQDPAAQDNDARAALYQKFTDHYKSTDPAQQKIAYETGKEYISKYSGLTDENNAAILKFIQNWVTKYERAAADFKRKSDFDAAVRGKDWPRAFDLGNKILADEPENVPVILTLGNIGYTNATAGRAVNRALLPESLKHMRRAAEVIEAGKVSAEQMKPYTSKEEAAAFFHLGISFGLMETQPEEGMKALIKLAQTNSAASKNPGTYSSLAFFYRKEYIKAAAEYQQKFPDGTEITPERKPEYDRLQGQLDRIADRIIDAYARSVALSTKPEHQTNKTEAMGELTRIYKSRHNESDAGLRELIAGVLAKPLPIPGQEPEPTPSTTPSTTPTTGGSTQASQTGRPAAATTPGGANTAKPAAATATPQPKSTTTAPRP